MNSSLVEDYELFSMRRPRAEDKEEEDKEDSSHRGPRVHISQKTMRIFLAEVQEKITNSSFIECQEFFSHRKLWSIFQ